MFRQFGGRVKLQPFSYAACLNFKVSEYTSQGVLLNIDVTICSYCQGFVKIIACIEEPVVINKILAHIRQGQKSTQDSVNASLGIRAPPIVSRQ